MRSKSSKYRSNARILYYLFLHGLRPRLLHLPLVPQPILRQAKGTPLPLLGELDIDMCALYWFNARSGAHIGFIALLCWQVGLREIWSTKIDEAAMQRRGQVNNDNCQQYLYTHHGLHPVQLPPRPLRLPLGSPLIPQQQREGLFVLGPLTVDEHLRGGLLSYRHFSFCSFCYFWSLDSDVVMVRNIATYTAIVI